MADVDSNLDDATNPPTNEGSPCEDEAALKRKSGDPGWNYGTLCDPTNKDAIKCNLCGFISKAGITRLKYHVSGIKGKGVAKYKGKEGDFGRLLAAKGCSENNSSYDPGVWWMTYGNTTPTLQKMAIKILSLTTSSSGCERNWSAFEGIHTKKKNRLDSQRLQDLVYVQFNAKLINKWTRVQNQNTDVWRSLDASKAQSWIVALSDADEEVEEGGSFEVGEEGIGVTNQEARELHDDDFISDEELVEGGENFEFNSDEEWSFDRNEDDYTQR